jgi:hypothetical protein
VKHSVILLKAESGMKLLSHFMLDTKLFFSNTKSFDSKQTLSCFLNRNNSATRFKANPEPFLSTLRHFVLSDQPRASVTWRHGGSKPWEGGWNG